MSRDAEHKAGELWTRREVLGAAGGQVVVRVLLEGFMEEDTSTIEVYNEEEARKFVKASIVPADFSARVPNAVIPEELCVDGRTRRQAAPKTKPQNPGGSIGTGLELYAGINILAQERGEKRIPKGLLDPRTVFNAFAEAVGGVEHIYCHTGAKNNVEDQLVCSGCAHMANALKNFAAYGLTSLQAEFLMERLSVDHEQPLTADNLPLTHLEHGIVINDSDKISVNSQATPEEDEGTQQMFAYDRHTHRRGLIALSGFIAERFSVPELQPRHLYAANDRQFNNTAKYIAKHLPQFKKIGLPKFVLTGSSVNSWDVRADGIVKAEKGQGH